MLARIAKFVTALIGVAGEAVTAGLVTGSTARWVELGIAGLTALAVYLVPNTPTKVPAPPAG